MTKGYVSVRRQAWRAAIVAAALSIAVLSAAPRPDETRVVAIGDVHGAFDRFVELLAAAGLIDEQRAWSGGRAILVQTGDLSDRGAGMRETLELVMSLEEQARRAGGRVHALLGNHEIMNMTGEMRDVTPEIFATFGGEAAMRAAFGPEGRYGRWLRARQAVARVDGTLFMHAGIDPEYTKASVSDINRAVREAIAQWDAGSRWLRRQKLVPEAASPAQVAEAARNQILEMNANAEQGKIRPDAHRVASLLLPVANIGQSVLFDARGPMWFRGYSTWTDAAGAARIAALTDRYDVSRIVTGHTVQPHGRIRERFDGRLFLIDTGMLGAPYFPAGRPSALVLTAESATPLYLD